MIHAVDFIKCERVVQQEIGIMIIVKDSASLINCIHMSHIDPMDGWCHRHCTFGNCLIDHVSGNAVHPAIPGEQRAAAAEAEEVRCRICRFAGFLPRIPGDAFEPPVPDTGGPGCHPLVHNLAKAGIICCEELTPVVEGEQPFPSLGDIVIRKHSAIFEPDEPVRGAPSRTTPSLCSDQEHGFQEEKRAYVASSIHHHQFEHHASS